MALSEEVALTREVPEPETVVAPLKITPGSPRSSAGNHMKKQDHLEYFDTDYNYNDSTVADEYPLKSSPTQMDHNLLMPPHKKVKKKKLFPLFHRHRHRDKSKTNRVVEDSSLLSKSWGGSSMDNTPRSSTSSLHQSDSWDITDEWVESLVHPKSLNDDSISLTPSVSESLRTESGGGLSPVKYMVTITLMSGHNLAVRDRTGTSDPYVKFKCPPFKYRSSIINRNLNPEWNEHFSFQVNKLETSLLIRVYDHDYGTFDDFMGGQTLNLADYANNHHQVVDVGLEDPTVKNENLGFLRIYIKISLLAEEEAIVEQSRLEKKHKISNLKVWNSILTITLLEAKDLPAMDQNGMSDPYCKFKIGRQKLKSTILSKSLNPKWMEKFDIRMFDDCSVLHIEVWDKDFPQNDDFMGGCSVDITDLKRDVTHDMWLPLIGVNGLDSSGSIHFTLVITGTPVTEETECHSNMEKSYVQGIFNCLDLKAIRENNIGHLCIKIDKVEDLVPMCNSFVLVELGNACVRTQTVWKTSDPVLDKMFHFTVRDVHDELELKVYRAGNRTDHLLGMVKVPLLRLRKGCQKFALKDKNCLLPARGTIQIETDFVYQPLRAMIRTINPREAKIIEEEHKFKKKVLLDNVKRVTNIFHTIISTVEFVKSTWSWENKVISAVSFLVFLILVIFGEVWMVSFVGVLAFFYQYVMLYLRHEHIWQNNDSDRIHMVTRTGSMDNNESDLSDFDDDKPTSLRTKFKQFQQILVLVQDVLGEVADMEEGIRNLLYWRVPFLGWMAIYVLTGATLVLYFIPIRYLILIWGINKYTKRLRDPHYIDNNELIDFLSRCPSNKQLEQWRESHTTMNHHKKSHRK